MSNIIDSKIAERITVGRIALLMRFPFWGNLVSRLRVFQETSDWCPTACTDGRAIYYNPEFVSPLTDKNIIFLFCHEVLHVVLSHLDRTNDSFHDGFIGNLAADYAVNQIVIDEGVGEAIGKHISFKNLMEFNKEENKDGTLYDPMFKGWSYEEIYEHLYKHKDELKDSLGNTSFSLHLELCDDSNDESGESSKPKLTKQELQEIKDSIYEALLNAAQAVAIGDVPSGIKRLIKNLIEPKMDWRELLTQQVESQVKSDYTYMQLGRRSFSSDIIFPRQQKQPRIKVDLLLDMSGSIGEKEIQIFFSEVAGIVSQYASFEIGVLCWDTQVYNYQTFTEENVNDLMDYEVAGGGGTDLSCVYEFFKEHEIVPAQAVVFTDGEIYDWGDPDYCETLFIIKNHREVIAPYGETVMYT